MREDWDKYYLKLVGNIGERSTCIRRHIGAIIVKDNRMIASGYNGAPSGVDHCSDRGLCIRDKKNIASGTCTEVCFAIHAELNALMQCARYGISSDGAKLYCTTQPCSTCIKHIMQAGITEVHYIYDYPDDFTFDLVKKSNIKLIKHDV